MNAQSYALRKLKDRHPEEYRTFYLEAKEVCKREYPERRDVCSLAAARSKNQLSRIYYNEYRELYKDAIFAGYPVVGRTIRKGVHG